jgi:hypothetical protein
MGRHDAEIADVVERFAVQEVIFRYSDAVTRGDYAQMRSVFAADAIWESPLLDMHFDDPGSFIDFVVEGSAAFDVLIQTSSNPVIELLAADRAKATTTIREMFKGTAATDGVFGAAGTELNVDQHGIYYDQLAKIDGEWLFTHRCFEPFLIASGTLSGDVVMRRPLHQKRA